MDHSFMGADAQPRPSTPGWNPSHATAGEEGWNPWPLGFIAVMQTLLFLGHWFIYHTLLSFWPMSPAFAHNLGIAMFLLSISFVVAAVLGFRFVNPLVKLVYTAAAAWLGMLNFFFWGAWVCWILDFAVRLGGPDAMVHRQVILAVVFGAAFLLSLYGFANARFIRVRRVTVSLPNLPASWHGRTALLLSDIHLGHVNGVRFARRIASLAARLKPSVLFIAGDLFDGSKCDAYRITAPLFNVSPPLGTYMCGGNHEDFGNTAEYFSALAQGGIHVLRNERVDVDGLQLVGASYAESNLPLRLRTFLDSLHLANGPASILLNHVPHRLPIAEQAGVSLQLSGHTHGGQIVPFTWITRRAFGKFTYGLQKFGKMQVLTSSGVGTWGPPMRVGTEPEVVLITFA